MLVLCVHTGSPFFSLPRSPFLDRRFFFSGSPHTGSPFLLFHGGCGVGGLSVLLCFALLCCRFADVLHFWTPVLGRCADGCGWGSPVCLRFRVW